MNGARLKECNRPPTAALTRKSASIRDADFLRMRESIIRNTQWSAQQNVKPLLPHRLCRATSGSCLPINHR
jgi:hypothetical protein